MRRRARPVKAKAGAKQRPKAPRKGRATAGHLEQRLAESLEQQAAAAAILHVISSSPTDVRSVFDTMAASALRLCDANLCTVFRYDGELIHLVALHQVSMEGAAAYRDAYPAPPGRGGGTHRAILTGSIVHIPDIRQDPEYELQELARANDFGCVLSVPMLRDERAIGAITVGRKAGKPFSAEQIDLLKIFAEQAVIAIENVRLFNETKEALEQQTATGEVLRVIASSPTDIQPVFAAVAASAARLCDAVDVTIFQVDGGLLRVAVHDGPIPSHPVGQGPSLARGTPSGRAILEGRTIHVADLQTEVDEFPEGSEHGWRLGFRTVLTVPLMREGVAIGAINLRRTEARLFTERQVALLQTFAAQAVIAIENVRLFRELDARTGELTRSVGELRALGEVGQAISASLDLQTVLSAIVVRATQLSGTDAGVIYEYDDAREVFVPRATERLEAEILETLLATPIRKGEGATGRLAEAREAFQVPDILEAPADSRVRDALVRAGYRALLAVPLLREEHLLGGLTVIRRAPGTFPAEVIDLLRTFATQSALAMQNARLFHEIEDKSGQLEVASRHKSEFLANMSHELRTPLNAIIGYSEMLAEEAQDRAQEAFVPDLERINVAAKHLLDLINDVLDLSKVEAGRMELEAATFELPAAIESALALVRERAGRRGVALGSAIDARVGSIRADERKVKQVLLNLLSNALKFTPEGGRVEVRAAARDHLVEVAVSDTGVGIAPEDQEAIFEEFRQVGTADKKVEGTGLGLTLARKFIELHGGRMWVASRLGEGATFTFTLPAT